MESKTYNISFNTNYLEHKGNKNSGRYPRGSGENPYQHDKSKHGGLKAGLAGAGISAVNLAANYNSTMKLGKTALDIHNNQVDAFNSQYGFPAVPKFDVDSFMTQWKIGYIVGGGVGTLAAAGISVASNYGSKKLFDVMMNKKLEKTKVKDIEGLKQRLQSDTANRRALLSTLGLVGVGINAILDDVRLEKEIKNYDKINQKTGKLKNKYKPHN